jgi:hypothetical protein
MGQKTLTMTLRYAHLSPGHQLDAVRRLDAGPTGTATGTDAESHTEAAEGACASAGGDEQNEWRRVESNHGPRDYETLALAI